MENRPAFERIALVGYAWLCFSVIALNCLSVFYPDLWRTLLNSVGSEGLIEYIQAALFFGSSVLLIYAAFAHLNGLRRHILLSIGLIVAFIFAEEISWGQHIFGFEPPNWFQNNNFQNELTFHNFLSDGGGSSQTLLAYVMFAIIFSAWLTNKNEIFDIPVPPLSLACGLLIALSYGSGILPRSVSGILADIPAKYGLLLLLLIYTIFRCLDKDKNLIWIAISTSALICLNEYATYMYNHHSYNSGLYWRVPRREESETSEYIYSIICFSYSVGILAFLNVKQDGRLNRWFGRDSENRSNIVRLLPVCSVVTGVSIGLVPAMYFYTEYIRDSVSTRFHSEVVLSGPVVRSSFDVYVTEGQLTYHRQPCAQTDLEAAFFLQVFPVGERDLFPDDIFPEDMRSRSLGFNNYLLKFGSVIGDTCVKTVDLPDYEIASIRTGQFTYEGGEIWVAEIPFPPVSIEDEMTRFYSEIAPSGPVVRSSFDVYAMEDQLTYHKQPCGPSDLEAAFFLHILPHEERDLPENRQSFGFDNQDFRINNVTGDTCIKTVDLPDYRIASIRTGQFTDEEQVWVAEIPWDAN